MPLTSIPIKQGITGRMKIRVSSLQPFNNTISRWIGFLPVGSVEPFRLDDESEWKPSEDAYAPFLLRRGTGSRFHAREGG